MIYTLNMFNNITFKKVEVILQCIFIFQSSLSLKILLILFATHIFKHTDYSSKFESKRH